MHERYVKFTSLITGINRSIHKIKSIEMAEFGLRSVHVSCLYNLYEAKELTAKQLSDVCGEDKASISRTIDYLESKGYIKCLSTAKKRYNALLNLTPLGEKIATVIIEKIDRILIEASSEITDTEREILYKSLETIDNNLKKICIPKGENNGN